MCRIERTGLQLREDAVRVIKTALAGTATTKFTDMMEAVFGIDENEEDIPEITPTAPEEDEEVPESMYATLGEAIEEEVPSTSAGKRSHLLVKSQLLRDRKGKVQFQLNLVRFPFRMPW